MTKVGMRGGTQALVPMCSMESRSRGQAEMGVETGELSNLAWLSHTPTYSSEPSMLTIIAMSSSSDINLVFVICVVGKGGIEE